MKKIICFLLAILILLSVASCNGATPPVDVDTNAGDVSGENTEKPIDDGKVAAPAYDGVFKVGFSRVVITPDLPATQKDGTVLRTKTDDIYTTCIAINDGDNTVLLYTVDVPNIGADNYKALQLRIKMATKVPAENIFMSATHDHSSVYLDADIGDGGTWARNNYKMFVQAAQEAIADLDDAEIYTGSGKTTGMAYVRRYLMTDGTYTNTPSTSDSHKVVGPASEADDTVLILRFVREGKKDIVMTNWQAHLATAISEKKVLTSDMAHYVRRDVEAADDVLVAYFQGASGNINIEAPNRELKKYKSHVEVGEALAKVIISEMAVEKLTKLEAGKIKTSNTTFAAEIRKDSEESIAQAKEVLAASGAQQKALMQKYGYETLYAPKSIVGNVGREIYNLPFGALSFGDVAFVTAPYEMFDTNGMQIKEGSPFRLTFVLTCAGDYGAYMPSYEAMTIYGGYEVENNQYALGVAEKAVEQFLSMLNEHKGIS